MSEEALEIAERSGDDLAVANGQAALGVTLVQRDTAEERDRGERHLTAVLMSKFPGGVTRLTVSQVKVARIDAEIELLKLQEAVKAKK